MPATILRTSDGRLDAADSHALEQLNERLANGSRKVVVYLHGGLVNLKDAEEMASRLSGTGEAALNLSQDWEQVYVLWRTGVGETIAANWVDIFENDKLYSALFKRLVSFISARLGSDAEGTRGSRSHGLSDGEIEARLSVKRGRPFYNLELLAQGPERQGVAATSDTDVKTELETFLLKDDELGKIGGDLDAYLAEITDDRTRGGTFGDPAAGARTYGRVAPVFRDELSERGDSGRARAFDLGGSLVAIARHGVEIAIRVVGRFRDGRDHGVHATIAEEIARELYADRIGAAIWSMMVKDAAQHFVDGLGTRLLEMFRPYTDLKLVVVGHSAGSIWATEMLMARGALAAQPKIDLVLLAPAVRTCKFAQMLKASGDSIGRLRIFAMRDELERADVLYPKIGYLYPSSLLYLVSGAFEHREGKSYTDAPLLGMERFIGSEPDWIAEAEERDALSEVREFIDAEPGRLVLSLSTLGAGLNSAAKSHGGFDDDPSTLASITSYLS